MATEFSEYVSVAAKSTKLFKLQDIAPVRIWDYKAPTLVQGSRFTNRVPWTQSEDFANKFFASYPLLKEIDLTNLAISGGAVIDHLLERNPKDIDIFVIIEKKLEAKEAADFAKNRIEKFVKDIYTHMSEKNQTLNELEAEKKLTDPNFRINRYEFFDLTEFSVARFRNVYTVNVPSMSIPIQLISSGYESLNDLFAQVDLPCTAVAFYQNEVLFSELCKFCYENLAVVPVTNFKDRCHIDRLVKYFNKGFDIILPHLDTTKIRTHNFQFDMEEMLDLPFLHIRVGEVLANKVDISYLEFNKYCANSDDDAPNALYVGNVGNSGGIGIHKNISNLIHDKWQDFLYEGQGPSYKNAFLERPLITERMIVNTYKTVQEKVWDEGCLSLDVLQKFYNHKKLTTFIDELILDTIRVSEEDNVKITFSSPTFDIQVREKVEQLTQSQIEFTKAKLMELQQSPVLVQTDRIEDRDETTSDEEWYGSYLAKSEGVTA